MSERKPFFKEWLEKLQQESWQLELIISGIVILGLREVIRYLDHFGTSLLNAEPNNDTIGLMLAMIGALYFGAFISLINLVIHVLTRSLWIGAIGLRYVSGDIDYDNLNYHPRFINFYKRKIGSFDKYIERLEDFASVIFSFTFLLVFIILSLFFYFFLFVFVASSIDGLSSGLLQNIAGGFIVVFLLGSIIVAFDFVTLGLLKRIKNKYFSAIYFWIYRFYSAITFSFLWRPMLLNFLDQAYTKRLFFLAVPYLLFLIFTSSITYSTKIVYPNFEALNKVVSGRDRVFFRKSMYAQSFNYRYYDDERAKLEERSDKNLLGLFSLPSNKLKGPLGEVFVRGRHGDRHLVTFKDSLLIPFEEEGWGFGGNGAVQISLTSNSSKVEEQQIQRTQVVQNMKGIQQILQDAVLLSIDDRAISPSKITCDYYNHPIGDTKGLLCFFPLDGLSIGRHSLKVGKVTGIKSKYNKDRSIRLDTSYLQVPFIYLGQ